MNVYEEAHSLSRAIKESEEYKQYKAVAEKIKQNEEVDKMLKDFMEKQLKVQAKQALGEDVPDDMMKTIQELSAIVMSDPAAAEYMQCQVRFMIMFQDVQNILAETLEV